MNEGGDVGESLVRGATEALHKAIGAVRVAATAAALGAVALVLGMMAAIMAAAAMIATVTGKMLSHVAQSLRDAIPTLVAAVPAMAEVLFVGLAVLAMLWSGWQIGVAFGMAWWSFTAVIAVAPAPLLLLYANRPTAGTAALALVCSLAVGWIVIRVPVWVLAATLGGLWLWLILTIGKELRNETETRERSDDRHDPDAPGPDADVRLYGIRLREESDAPGVGPGAGDSGIGNVGGSDHVGVRGTSLGQD